MRAADTARFHELVVSIMERDRMEGIAADSRFQPFDMWPSVTEPYDFDREDEGQLLGSYGAQTMFAIATACAYDHEVWSSELEVVGLEDEGRWGLCINSGWEDELPPVVLPFLTPEWMARFLQCFADIRSRIFDGSYSQPLCTGEEMALHVALETARDATDEWDGWFHSAFPQVDPDVLVGFLNQAQSLHFEDHDVLMLWELPFMIGQPGEGSFLHPENWFVPFSPDAPVRGPADAALLALGE